MSKQDGGPAFPFYRPEIRAAGGKVIRSHDEQDGMTLRDYFAGQALAAMLTQPADAQNISAYDNPTKAACWAYEFADAMLAERVNNITAK